MSDLLRLELRMMESHYTKDKIFLALWLFCGESPETKTQIGKVTLRCSRAGKKNALLIFLIPEPE